MSPSITIGPPATGDDFYDRELLLQEVEAALVKGSVLLAAPRRVGKTSLMLHLRDRSVDPRFAFYIEAEDFSLPEDLVADIILKVARRQPAFLRFLTDTLSGFVSNVEDLELWEIKLKLRERLRGHWSRRGTEAIEELLSKGGSCLLLIDELSILLHRLGATPETAIQGVELVHWLRSLRQQFSGALSMVLGSSVGIGRIVSNLGASRALNDLRQIEVRPFDRETARTFADSLLQSRGLRVSSEVLDSFLSHVGTFVPMFIQIMADALSKEARKQSVEATPELVAWCYKERVLGPEFRNHFEDYYERLSRYYTPEEARAAKRILRDLALSAVGIKRSQLHDAFVQELGSSADPERFDLLVAALENDFYVRAEDERFTFHNRWLQDWWRRHHALGS